MDRWNIVSTLNYLEHDEEEKIVLVEGAQTTATRRASETIKAMVAVADLTRGAFMAGDISTVMSPRTVITWAENAEIFGDLGFAFRVTFLNKCDETGAPQIAEFYQRCFGKELPEIGGRRRRPRAEPEGAMSSQDDNIVEPFKRAIAGTMRAMSRDDELEVASASRTAAVSGPQRPADPAAARARRRTPSPLRAARPTPWRSSCATTTPRSTPSAGRQARSAAPSSSAVEQARCEVDRRHADEGRGARTSAVVLEEQCQDQGPAPRRRARRRPRSPTSSACIVREKLTGEPPPPSARKVGRHVAQLGRAQASAPTSRAWRDQMREPGRLRQRSCAS